MSNEKNNAPQRHSNFLRAIVEHDLAAGTHARAGLPPSSRAFRPSRTATCTSATPSRSASTSASRATTAARATCASTTPTRRRRSRSTSTRSSTRCTGWASTGAHDEHLYYASDYFDCMYQLRRAADRARPRLRRQPERRGDARASAARSPSPGKRLALPRPRRRPRTSTLLRADARRRVPGRRARAAREDRHGLAQHQPARPGDLPHPPCARTTAPATTGASTRCTTTRTRSRTRSRTSRTRCARSSSRTTGRSTTGCSSALADGGLLAAAAAAADRVRAPEPHLRRH